MLYNAMIKGFPSATGEPFHYEFVVDNPAQKDKIESFMPDILQSLRNFVSNDSVMLSVKVRERQPGEKNLESDRAYERGCGTQPQSARVYKEISTKPRLIDGAAANNIE